MGQGQAIFTHSGSYLWVKSLDPNRVYGKADTATVNAPISG